MGILVLALKYPKKCGVVESHPKHAAGIGNLRLSDPTCADQFSEKKGFEINFYWLLQKKCQRTCSASLIVGAKAYLTRRAIYE